MTYVYSKSKDAEIWQHTKLDDLVTEIVQEEGITEETVLYLYKGKVKKQRVGTFAPDLTEVLGNYAYDNFDEDYVDEWLDSIKEEDLQKDFENFLNKWFRQRKIEPDVNHVVEIEPITVGVAMSPKITAIPIPNLNGK